MKLDIDSATELANNYISKAGYLFTKIVSVKFKDGQWTVIVDVGTYKNEIKTITIDDESGKVIGYE